MSHPLKTELRTGVLEAQGIPATGAAAAMPSPASTDALASGRIATFDAAPSPRSLVSMVVPVYNESAVIPAFYERASAALAELGCDYEFVFVDDGSQDDSYQRLSASAASHPRVKVVKFSRNFGHQIAITAGIDHARGDWVVVIVAGVQDPPEVVRS